jgi:hypothetical protein
MNWFDKWLYGKVKNAWENKRQFDKDKEYQVSLKEHTLNAINIGSVGIAGGGRLDCPPDLNFKMYRAENGYVMEVRQHDRKTDRQNVNLHVIAESEDLGTAISHIITLESLKVN